MSRKERDARYRDKLRKDIFDHYGAYCHCCGETQREFLCVDHINNDGKLYRTNRRGGWVTYRRIRQMGYPDDIQILCHNCNAAKGIYGECPHRRVQAE